MRTDYVIDEMISAKAIAARVEALAREISEFFAGTDKLVKYSAMFGLSPLDRQNLRIADPGPPTAKVATRPRTAFDRMGAPGKPPAAG